MRTMFILTVVLIIGAIVLAVKLRTDYDNEYAKQFEEYSKKQRIHFIRDSTQADMKYRHDSIEYEYYKRHF